MTNSPLSRLSLSRSPVKSPLLRALRQSGVLIVLGLIIETLTLAWSHPTAFLIFLLAGALLVVAGIARYLFAFFSLSRPASAFETESPPP